MTTEHTHLPEMELYDFIESTSTIECFACKNADVLHDDFTEALEYFYKEGWRAFENEVYCRLCLKRINKSKKSNK